MSVMNINEVSGLQVLSMDEIDEVSGGNAQVVRYAIRVGLGLAAVGGIGVVVGVAAAAGMYYLMTE